MLFSKLAFDYFSKKQFMPKLISLKVIDFHEMQALERLAKKGTAFEARRARFILTLATPNGLCPNQIGAAHGFCAATSSNLRDRFNDMGPDGCRYQLDELTNVSRCKLSFEAQERAVAIVKTEALTLAGIMAKLKQEELVPKNEPNGHALADTLKRADMSFQRTRYSLKKLLSLSFGICRSRQA